ncbi:hypothetical protein K6U52_06670 [Vibrio vulnificus]|nr:hypothetical protein [Vibrio vulnificus]MCG9655845.1 hypothetical protein [Vibrio vulnificus]MCU8238592.1 hypothetical protein [Vibrio vulnificus]MCU8326519.1 hypothetical protein [Vibrio vulnificus]
MVCGSFGIACLTP